MEIDMALSKNPLDISMEIQGDDDAISMAMEQSIGGGTRDYEKLIHKPSINGTELIGNYDEIDPTVPSWAKNPTKPTYTPDEVGAIDENNEMSFADIKSIWDSIFI